MLPALPTGIARMSGAVPSWSHTSNAAVFCPSRRYGLTEFTNVTGAFSLTLRTICNASSKFPSISTISAPYMTAWASLPSATFPFGITMIARIPARAA